MVKKGLVITFVLDYYFSESIYHCDDPSIHFLPYNAKMISKYLQDLERSLKMKFYSIAMFPYNLIGLLT